MRIAPFICFLFLLSAYSNAQPVEIEVLSQKFCDCFEKRSKDSIAITDPFKDCNSEINHTPEFDSLCQRYLQKNMDVFSEFPEHTLAGIRTKVAMDVLNLAFLKCDYFNSLVSEYNKNNIQFKPSLDSICTCFTTTPEKWKPIDRRIKECIINNGHMIDNYIKPWTTAQKRKYFDGVSYHFLKNCEGFRLLFEEQFFHSVYSVLLNATSHETKLLKAKAETWLEQLRKDEKRGILTNLSADRKNEQGLMDTLEMIMKDLQKLKTSVKMEAYTYGSHKDCEILAVYTVKKGKTVNRVYKLTLYMDGAKENSKVRRVSFMNKKQIAADEKEWSKKYGEIPPPPPPPPPMPPSRKKLKY